MARKKLKLQWIANDSARKASLKKRKKSLMKKARELSTLCGLSACAIIYYPNEPQPDVWPNSSDAHKMVIRFTSMPDIEQSKRMSNQESFLKEKLNKLHARVEKKQKKNQLYEVKEIMNHILSGRILIIDVGINHLTDMVYMIDDKIKAVKDQIEVTRNMMLPVALTPSFHQEIMEDCSGLVDVDGNCYDLVEAMEDLGKKKWFAEIVNEEQSNVGVNMLHSSTI